MAQRKGNLMGDYYLMKPHSQQDILYINSSKLNYIATRTELSGKIAKECVQGIACSINSMHNRIYSGILKECDYEKTRKRFTRP